MPAFGIYFDERGKGKTEIRFYGPKRLNRCLYKLTKDGFDKDYYRILKNMQENSD